MAGPAVLGAGARDIRAIAEARAAIKNNPDNAVAQFWLGAALAFAGREEEGIPRFESVLELSPRDPQNQFYTTHLALAYLSSGQPRRGLEWARLAALRRSDFIKAPPTLVSILAHLGQKEEARAALEPIAVADLGSVERRPHWRRYKDPRTKELVLEGLRSAALPD